MNAKLKWNVGFGYKDYIYSNIGLRLFDHWSVQSSWLFGTNSECNSCYLGIPNYYVDKSCSLVFDNHVIILRSVLIY